MQCQFWNLYKYLYASNFVEKINDVVEKVLPSGIFGGLGFFNQHQKHIQNPAKRLRWSVLQKQLILWWLSSKNVPS